MAAGYESASMGVWAWVASLQAVVGVLCWGMSSQLSRYEEVQNPKTQTISYITSSTFSGLGTAAFISAIIVVTCVSIGYFVIPRFCSLLMALAGLLSEAVALAATIIVGLIIDKAMPIRSSELDSIRLGTEPPSEYDYTVRVVNQMKPVLAAIGVGAFISFILAARGQVMASSARALDAIVFSACLAIAAALGVFTTLQHAAVPSVLWLGVLWVVGTALLFILLQQQKVFWPRFTSIAAALLSALLALLSLTGASVCSRKFSKHKVYPLVLNDLNLRDVLPGVGEEQYKEMVTAIKSSYNYDFFIISVLSGAAAVGFIASTLAAFRSVLGPSPAEKEMAQESAEEAVEGRGDA